MPTRAGRLGASPFRVFIPKGDSLATGARAHWRHGHDPAFTRRLGQLRAATLHRLAAAKLGAAPCQASQRNDRRLARHGSGRLVPWQRHEPLLAGRPQQPQRCRRRTYTASVMTQRAVRPAMSDPSFLCIVATLLAMLANRPGRAQLVWFFAGSVLGPVLAALALSALALPAKGSGLHVVENSA